MSLITCSECNKEISDKAQACPYCGCPLNCGKYRIIITGYEADYSALAGIEETFHYNLSYVEGMSILNNLPYPIAEFDTQEEMEIFATELNSVRWGMNISTEYSDGKPIYVRSSNMIKCPTCSSKNITRISTSSKVFGIAMFGLLSNRRMKTFHCNTCKYEW